MGVHYYLDYIKLIYLEEKDAFRPLAPPLTRFYSFPNRRIEANRFTHCREESEHLAQIIENTVRSKEASQSTIVPQLSVSVSAQDPTFEKITQHSLKTNHRTKKSFCDNSVASIFFVCLLLLACYICKRRFFG